mmetsp:Transcript_13554/g.30882  ORF Transcript_13554/g.30882 Transcript_13554/m.30882 type:complete len:740 (+) Transcript_13554:68-2287(+)
MKPTACCGTQKLLAEVHSQSLTEFEPHVPFAEKMTYPATLPLKEDTLLAQDTIVDCVRYEHAMTRCCIEKMQGLVEDLLARSNNSPLWSPATPDERWTQRQAPPPRSSIDLSDGSANGAPGKRISIVETEGSNDQDKEAKFVNGGDDARRRPAPRMLTTTDYAEESQNVAGIDFNSVQSAEDGRFKPATSNASFKRSASGGTTPGVRSKATTTSKRKVAVQEARKRMATTLNALAGAKGWSAAARMLDDSAPMAWTVDTSICRWLTPMRFQNASCILVLAYSVYIGVEADHHLDSSRRDKDASSMFYTANVIFAALFAMEITTRMALERKAFFTGREYRWNLMDLFLVATQFIDLAFHIWNLGFLRVMRVMRVVRAGRVLRSMRYFTELRVMVMSIISSLTSLMWAFVLVAFVLYLTSILIMEVITSELVNSDPSASTVHPKLFHYYGTLGATLLTLFKSISGGADWEDLVTPLVEFNKAYVIIFVTYVAFMVFGVMNVLTAIFVESATQIAQVDQDLAIQEQLRRDSSTINMIKAMFNEADKDGSGILTSEEFEELLTDEKYIFAMRLIDIDIAEARGLFQLLDLGETGEVSIQEFVTGMMRLKGSAKGIDLATLIYENKKMYHHIHDSFHAMMDRIQHLDRDVQVVMKSSHVLHDLVVARNRSEEGKGESDSGGRRARAKGNTADHGARGSSLPPAVLPTPRLYDATVPTPTCSRRIDLTATKVLPDLNGTPMTLQL